MSFAGSVGGSDRLRLFCALRLPEPALDELERWQREHIGAGRPVPRANLHVTLAFLGSRPAADLAALAGVLRESAAESAPMELRAERYRETRSVGMLALADPSGRAALLAAAVQERLEELGLYRRERRPWLPHVTVVRFRERPRLAPPVPQLVTAPSEAAAYISRLRPDGARYEVQESFALGG